MNCAAISGAVSSSYSLVRGDVGSTIRVGVVASNSVGSTSATSAQTAVVAKARKNDGNKSDEAKEPIAKAA